MYLPSLWFVWDDYYSEGLRVKFTVYLRLTLSSTLRVEDGSSTQALVLQIKIFEFSDLRV